MRLVALTGIAVLMFTVSTLSGQSDKLVANHAPSPEPVLSCADVDGDGTAGMADVMRVLGAVPSAYPSPQYVALYDLAHADQSVGMADVTAALADVPSICPLVDTQIAQATQAILASPQYITEDATFLASQGYFRSSQDVPGQGVHYVHPTYFNDDQFEPTQPDGLVYHNGRLAAQLYYIDGDVVGWGGVPNHSHNVDIDQFCSPQPCSWDGSEDGWHDHVQLCTAWIGTIYATAIPGVASAQDCEDIHNGQPYGGTWNWEDRVGWMGHLWSHQVNPNGRFADCHPDEADWKPFNCPS